MGILKRWWWVVVAVIVVIVGAYLVFGRAGSAAPGTPNSPGSTDSTSSAAAPSTGTPSTPGEPAPTEPTSSGTEKPGAAQVKVAKSGSKLTTVTAPPAATLARLTFSAARVDQAYDAVFRPYGTGPARAGHGTIAVAVSDFTPQKDYGDDALRLPGPNVLLELGPGINVMAGGTYEGVVKLMKSGDGLVFVLTSVKRD